MNNDALLQKLTEQGDNYISGAELARWLGVSRTMVWKGIEQLRAEGYGIESVTNRGYRLLPEHDVLSAREIALRLTTPGLRLRVYPSVTSTNTILKNMAAAGEPEGAVAVAGEQTAGRGRMGRSFYSPPGTGLYLSILLRPGIPAEETTPVTACAAVAVAESIEELSGEPAQIKWVNDVYVRGKKVCGILTEASIDCETRIADYLVVGIGVNTAPSPPGIFPRNCGASPVQPLPPGACPRCAAGWRRGSWTGSLAITATWGGGSFLTATSAAPSSWAGV